MAKDIVVTNEGKGKDFDPIPAGPTIGICYGVYSIGTQTKVWKGEKKQMEQIVVCFELPSERIKIKDKVTGEEKDLPRAISSVYTKSLGEKSNLRKDLAAWRGRDFTEAELKGFSLKNILGHAGLLNIVHEPKDGGGVWSNIKGIMPLMKGTPKPTAENPLRMWSIGDPTDGVPAWILAKAQKALEWVPDEPAAEQPADDKHEDDDDQNVPF